MLTFAKLANELIYATKLTNEDLVNILLACVYEPLDLKDKMAIHIMPEKVNAVIC